MSKTEQLKELILRDEWRLEILQVVQELSSQELWIGAGFVRNLVWDHLHDYPRMTPLNDIDVVFYNRNCTKELDTSLETSLQALKPDLKWSVKNQSYTHLMHGHKPYKHLEEALTHWVETATAIAVRLNVKNELEIVAPYGLDDLFDLKIKATSSVKRGVAKSRAEKKDWLGTWPKLVLS